MFRPSNHFGVVVLFGIAPFIDLVAFLPGFLDSFLKLYWVSPQPRPPNHFSEDPKRMKQASPTAALGSFLKSLLEPAQDSTPESSLPSETWHFSPKTGAI